MSRRIFSFGLLAACALLLLLPPIAFAGSTVIFSTGFEQSEGYIAGFPLDGQRGWVANGTGGNGVLSGVNQQVFLGYNAPLSDSETSTTVWKPLNYGSVLSNSILKFYVEMAVIDSSPGVIDRDEFRWSVYNTNDNRLFSLIFDNGSLEIFSFLSDGTTYDTGISFRNGVSYTLVILMDFAQNRWNASLNGSDLKINSPISVNPQVPLTFGDVDAVWFYTDPANPGDNYMLFDNYRVSLESATRPTLQSISATNRQFRLRLFGENGVGYAVEASSTLASNSWVAIATNIVSSGSFDLVDPMQPPPSQRFYRGRWVP